VCLVIVITPRRPLKKSTCCVAATASMLNVLRVRLRLKPCRALHLELFERPQAAVNYTCLVSFNEFFNILLVNLFKEFEDFLWTGHRTCIV